MDQEACGYLVPEAAPDQFLDWLIEQPSCENLVLVSHMPLVSLLSALWVGEPRSRPGFRVGSVGGIAASESAGSAELASCASSSTASAT